MEAADFGLVDRGRRQDAGGGGRTREIGDDQPGLARQPLMGFELAAAPVGEQVGAGLAPGAGDAVGIGEAEQGPALRPCPASAPPPAQRRARPRMSSARRPRSRRKRSTRSARSGMSPPSPRSTSTAASSAASSPCPLCAPSATMRASLGGSGRARSLRPSAVMRPFPSIAPREPSNSRASFTAGFGGGSRKASEAGSVTPQAARSSSSGARSAERISGGAKAGSAPVAASSQSR